MTYQEIINNIKNLTIQGAEKIAISAVEAFALKLKETEDPGTLEIACKELTATRPTEPALRNALTYCLNNYKTNPDVTTHVIDYFKSSKEKIAEIGAKKIEDGMIVFTHCHSSTVEAIIIKAHQQGKKITVYNTETRPRYQGRITAENLAKAGLPVVHFIDSAGRGFIRKADLFLFGCDAINIEGKIFNKIGTEGLVSAAYDSHIPAYSASNSWKFDPLTIMGTEEEIEERSSNEVWDNPPAGIIIRNPAFEVIPPQLVTGIITEIGVYGPSSLITGIQENYPWMIKL